MEPNENNLTNKKKKIEISDIILHIIVYGLVAIAGAFILFAVIVLALMCYVFWEGFGWTIIFSALILYASYVGLERATTCRTNTLDGFILKPKKLPKLAMIVLLIGFGFYLMAAWDSGVANPQFQEKISWILKIENKSWEQDLSNHGRGALHSLGYFITSNMIFLAMFQAYVLFRDRHDYVEVSKDFVLFKDNNNGGSFSLNGITALVLSPKEAIGSLKFIYDGNNHFFIPISKMNFGEREKLELLDALQEKLSIKVTDGFAKTDNKTAT